MNSPQVARLLVCIAALVNLPSGKAQMANTMPAISAAAPAPPAVRQAPASALTPPRPFSSFAFSGEVSTLGVRLQTATYLTPRLNLRASGSILGFSDTISTNGFQVDTKLHLSSAGLSLDYFPFPAHGWRISPGLLFYNANGADMTFTALPGTSFSLNNYTYYSSPDDPVKGMGGVGLHSRNPAFTITTGWGNMVRPKGHFSFPVEVGIALIGTPTFNMALTSGQVCDANGQNCVNVATDPDVQANLQAQVSKYRKDVAPLKTWPIVSFGVAYTFRRPY